MHIARVAGKKTLRLYVCSLSVPSFSLYSQYYYVQQKRTRRKNYLKCFEIQKGIARLISNVQGVVRGGRKIELLFSGLFSIFMPFELCHFFCVCMCVCLQHLSAFAHFEMEVEKTRQLFPFAEAAAATVTTHIKIKSIGLNHHYGDGNGLGFGLNLINSKVVSSCFRYNFDYTT